MYSFPNLEPVCCFMSSSNCCFLTCIQISQEAGKVVWYSCLSEIGVFLEFSRFFYDPMDVDNLISGSSNFFKTSLNMWKFTVHILLKPGLENFEHYFASMWDEWNCAVVWTFFGIAFFKDWNEIWPFPLPWPLLSFQTCWHIDCSTLTASYFRIWNSLSGIPSPPSFIHSNAS